jgi:hypothetical protein
MEITRYGNNITWQSEEGTKYKTRQQCHHLPLICKIGVLLSLRFWFPLVAGACFGLFGSFINVGSSFAGTVLQEERIKASVIITQKV